MSTLQTTVCPLCGCSRFRVRTRPYAGASGLSIECTDSECSFSVQPDMEALAEAAVSTWNRYAKDCKRTAEAEARRSPVSGCRVGEPCRGYSVLGCPVHSMPPRRVA